MKKLIALVILMVGCSESTHENTVDPEVLAAKQQVKLKKFASESLPKGCRNIVSLGNNWITFELETDGETRRFLYHKEWHGTSRGYMVASESLTELSEKTTKD
jgi:hypothetical protein